MRAGSSPAPGTKGLCCSSNVRPWRNRQTHLAQDQTPHGTECSSHSGRTRV